MNIKKQRDEILLRHGGLAPIAGAMGQVDEPEPSSNPTTPTPIPQSFS